MLYRISSRSNASLISFKDASLRETSSDIGDLPSELGDLGDLGDRGDLGDLGDFAKGLAL